MDLTADCSQCFGLCCVALPFAVSVDFAVTKAAGEPCTNLRDDDTCAIHADLRGRGFPGCTVYDCFGAGQHVSQVTFEGVNWRKAPETAESMFAVFTVMRQLHELAVYLTEALALAPARSVHGDLAAARGEVERHRLDTPEALLALDVAALHGQVGPLLHEASALTRAEALRMPRAGRLAGASSRRAGARRRGADLAGADLVGADLQGADLFGADLRGAYLIAADLRGADLRAADLFGADLRDADVRGAALTDSLFLSQSQIASARGDATTSLPARLERPRHWTGFSR